MDAVVKAKKGYPIWTLLVIMTLMAVLFVLPQRFMPDSSHSTAHTLFFIAHQIAFWLTVGFLVWLVLGKHRVVLRIVVLAVIVVWGPAVLVCIESWIRNSGQITLVELAMRKLNVYDAYVHIYATAYYSFGYSDEH